jgi:hypothetical protein
VAGIAALSIFGLLGAWWLWCFREHVRAIAWRLLLTAVGRYLLRRAIALAALAAWLLTPAAQQDGWRGWVLLLVWLAMVGRTLWPRELIAVNKRGQ